MTSIRRLQDVQIGDVDLIGTYRDTFDNIDIETAQELIDTNTLKSYVLQSEWMNDVKGRIEDLEEYKVTECDDVFVDKTEEFQFHIDEFEYINEYSSSTEYYENNFVLYNDEIYFCIKDSLNNLPTNTTYWLKIGLMGEKGEYSLGVVYKGDWHDLTQYYKYDLVLFSGDIYVAKQNNINSQPTSNSDWFLLSNSNELIKLYDSPQDYTLLPVYSIFFQKL